MRASRARARKRLRGAVVVVAATVWHGRRNDAATAIFVGATGGRPRSAKGILVLPFVVFLLKKAGDRWSPLQDEKGANKGRMWRRSDVSGKAGDGWSPLQGTTKQTWRGTAWFWIGQAAPVAPVEKKKICFRTV